MAESLRKRGVGDALVISSMLFAFWHWNFQAYRYYFMVGILLFLLYWKRGMVASISAHAAFNGTLLLVTLVALHGDARVFHETGVSLRAPAAWTAQDVSPEPGEVLALSGPSGASLAVRRAGLYGSTASQLRDSIERRGLPEDDVVVKRGSLRTMQLPTGPAVWMEATWADEPAVVVAVPRGGRGWIVVIDTAGSARAQRDASEILESLSLD